MTSPVPAEPVGMPATSIGAAFSTDPKTPEQRKQILAQGIANQLARGNFRVETQSDYSAILVQGKPINHALHIIASLLTLVWIIGYIVILTQGGEKRFMLQVDDYGNQTLQKLT